MRNETELSNPPSSPSTPSTQVVVEEVGALSDFQWGRMGLAMGVCLLIVLAVVAYDLWG